MPGYPLTKPVSALRKPLASANVPRRGQREAFPMQFQRERTDTEGREALRKRDQSGL